MRQTCRSRAWLISMSKLNFRGRTPSMIMPSPLRECPPVRLLQQWLREIKGWCIMHRFNAAWLILITRDLDKREEKDLRSSWSPALSFKQESLPRMQKTLRKIVLYFSFWVVQWWGLGEHRSFRGEQDVILSLRCEGILHCISCVRCCLVLLWLILCPLLWLCIVLVP